MRGLSLLAVMLTLMVVGAVYLTVRRLGYLEEYDGGSFVFENHTLTAKRGQILFVRPLLEGASGARYWVGGVEVEPDRDDPNLQIPYVQTGLQEGSVEKKEWSPFRGIQPIPLNLLGAMTPNEWLEEIRPVRERLRDGGSRVLLRAVYGHTSGGSVLYYFDPERPVPCFGWFRHEKVVTDQPPEIHFSSSGGLLDPERD